MKRRSARVAELEAPTRTSERSERERRARPRAGAARPGAGRRLAGVTAVVTAGLVVLSGCSFRGVDSLPLPGGPDLGDNPYEIKVEFANVLDLVPQSVAKLNDVSVGKVTDVELGDRTTQGGWNAKVTVLVRRDVNLPDNATATIGQTSLLGEKYVSLSAPVNEAPLGRLGGGDTIPISRTTRNTEIEEVLAALSLLLNGGGLEQVSTITNELNAAMKGRTGEIKEVLHRVDAFVGTLDRHRSSITRALDSIDRLSTRLNAQKQTIVDTLDKTGPAVRILDRNRADLTKMLVSLDRLSKVTTRVVNTSHADIVANLRALQPLLRNLEKAGSDLPNSLETMITFPFPPTFANIVEGDYGNISMTLDLNMDELAKNLLGGTDLEKSLANQAKQMNALVKPPSVGLPQAPPGVLTGLRDALNGLGGGTGTGGTGTGGAGTGGTGAGTGGTQRPGALAPVSGTGNPGLSNLVMGGLS